VPSNPRQHPDFEAGNTLAMKHGAQSPRRVDPLAQQIMAEAMADPALEFLQQPRFSAGLLAWARAEARVQLIDEWVSTMSMEQAAQSGQGRTSPLELLRKWETTAAGHRARLGLDPVSAARLGKDIAQGRQADAATALTKMREAHERAIRGEEATGE
jgi:hypothetical protein